MDWAISHGVETATFHVLTPYPGTALYARMAAQRRFTTSDWDLYDTRHAVFTPARMSGTQLENGYHWAYKRFYEWGSIFRGARAHQDLVGGLRHLAYAGGWKKFEPLWDLVIRAKRAGAMLPVLETILDAGGRGMEAGSSDPASVPGSKDPGLHHPARNQALISSSARATASGFVD